jgi:hypothetical protein
MGWVKEDLLTRRRRLAMGQEICCIRRAAQWPSSFLLIPVQQALTGVVP